MNSKQNLIDWLSDIEDTIARIEAKLDEQKERIDAIVDAIEDHEYETDHEDHELGGEG